MTKQEVEKTLGASLAQARERAIGDLHFFDKNKIDVKTIDNALTDYTFVLMDTGSDHANLTDEYAAIPVEMKKVAEVLGKTRLADVDENDFYRNLATIRQKAGDRARILIRLQELSNGFKFIIPFNSVYYYNPKDNYTDIGLDLHIRSMYKWLQEIKLEEYFI